MAELCGVSCTDASARSRGIGPQPTAAATVTGPPVPIPPRPPLLPPGVTSFTPFHVIGSGFKESS